MNKVLEIGAGAVLLAACLGHQAMAATMTFNGQTNTAISPVVPYTENGLTMTPTSPSAGTHYDFYGNNLGGSVPDNVAAVHTGNGGEQVTFTFSGGAFDLLSVDITAWLVGLDDLLPHTAVFESSSLATFNVDSPATGLIDFSSMSGWSNILFFTLTMPISQFACNAGSSNCTSMAFDDVTFQAASTVPLPAAFPLLLAGLGALGLMARRKNQRKTV